MKHVKRYFLLLALICVTGVILTRPQIHYLAGQASESLQAYYVSARADAVNEKGFTLSCNGMMLDIENMKMSSKMHVLIPLSDAVNWLKASVTVGESGQCYVQGQYFPDIIMVESAEEEKDGRTPENMMIDITEAAPAMGMTYQWNDATREASLHATVGDVFPERYDLREHRTLNVVENQGTFGTCWAFASTAALETAQDDSDMMDFSVDHMTMNGGFQIDPTGGGDYTMALAYLASWKGPVHEADDPYGDGMTDATLSAVRHFQEARMFEEKNLNKIKSMIIQYGGMESSLYMSIQNAWDSSDDYNPITASYYYTGNEKPNHDIVIVGWDDNYSRDNFNDRPESNGAFLCRNSWGEEFGDDGYFYVSYEDANLGTNNIVYTRLDATDNYQKIYQSDLLGWVGTLGYKKPSAWFANVYTAKSDELLRAASFYAVDAHTTYDIYAVPEYHSPEDLQQRIYLGSGYCEDSGYYTIDIPEMIRLKANCKFAVVVQIKTEECERPIAVEYGASELTSGADLRDGEGYISYDGSQWISTESEYGCNVCLKAFTD